MPQFIGKPLAVTAEQFTLGNALNVATLLNSMGVPLTLTFTGTGTPKDATAKMSFISLGKDYDVSLGDWVIYDGETFYVLKAGEFAKFFRAA